MTDRIGTFSKSRFGHGWSLLGWVTWDYLSRTIFLLSLLVFCSNLKSQDFKLTSINLTVQDGLAGDNVYCAMQDDKGYIWFGTETGISRYNGHSFENFYMSDGLADNEIFRIDQDSQGRIWFSAFNGKLSYYHNGIFHNQENDAVLAQVDLKIYYVNIFEDSKKNIWLMTKRRTTMIGANGLVTVDVNAGAGQDNAGNNNIAKQFTTTFDGTAPTVTVTTPTTIVSGTFTTTFTFSDPVSGFSLGGITVTNGTAGSFTAVSSTVYTAAITPTASGTVTVEADAGAAADVAGNGNTTADISVNYNRASTDITLSSTSILENSGIGATVGTMSTTDPDPADIHIYTLVSGTGDTDNSDFIMVGNVLTTLSDFDRETKSSYSIRVETEDGNGHKFEKQFTITIDNVAEADMRITGDLMIPGTALGTTANFTVTVHNDGHADLTISSITYPTAFGGPVTGITVTPGNNQILNMTFSPTAAITYSGDITVTSNGGTGVLAVSADGAIVTATEDEPLTEESVSIYPNPASNVLNIDLSKFNGKSLDISIHDLNGIKRFARKNHAADRLSIDVSSYNTGVYLIMFNDGRQLVQKKVMIKH